MNATESTEMLCRVSIRDAAHEKWLSLTLADKEARIKPAIATKMAKYALHTAEKNLLAFQRKLDRKYSVHTQEFKREHKRRLDAVSESENNIIILNSKIAQVISGMTVMDMVVLEDYNTQLGTEKSKLGARKHSLRNYEKMHGLEPTLQPEAETNVKAQPTAENKTIKLKLTEIPADFDFLLSDTFNSTREKVSAEPNLKINTEFSLDDLKMP